MLEITKYKKEVLLSSEATNANRTGFLMRLLRMDDIHEAVMKKDANLVKCILSHCDGSLLVCKQNSLGETPLHIAAAAGCIDIAKLLLKYGPDVNSKGRAECCPLIYAASHGDILMNQLLIQYGAVVDSSDPNGNTALQIACFSGNKELVQYLVGECANINSRNKFHEPIIYTTARALTLIFQNPPKESKENQFLSDRIQAYLDILYTLLNRGVEVTDFVHDCHFMLTKSVCQSSPSLHEKWAKEIAKLELSIRLAALNSDMHQLCENYAARNEIVGRPENFVEGQDTGIQRRLSSEELTIQNCRLIDRFLFSEIDKLRMKSGEMYEYTLQRIQNQTSIDSGCTAHTFDKESAIELINDEDGYFAPAGMSLKFDGKVTCMKMNHRGDALLAVACSDKSIRIFKVSQRDVLVQMIQEKICPWGVLTDLEWSSVYPKIYGICGSKICSVDVNNGDLRLECDVGIELRLIKSHPFMSNMLIVGNSQNIVFLVNVETGKIIQRSELAGTLKSVCFDVTGSSMYLGDAKGVVYQTNLNISDGRWRIRSKAVVSKGYPVTSLGFTAPCPSLGSKLPVLMTHSADNRVRLFNVISRPLFLLHPTVEYPVVCNRMYPSLSDEILVQSQFCQAPTAHGGKLFVISGSENSSVYVYDVGKGMCLELPNHIHPVTQIAWSRQMNQLATLDSNSNIFFWFYK